MRKERLVALSGFVAFLALNLVATATGSVVTNPSFENVHDGAMPYGGSTHGRDHMGMPDDWEWRVSGAMNAHGLSGTTTDGDWFLYLFAANFGDHSIGDFLEFYQSADLTDVSFVAFDVRLQGGSHTNTYFAIDSQKLWIENEATLSSEGTLSWTEVMIDTSSLSGFHEISIGVEVFEAFGSDPDGWTSIDNITPEPSTLTLLGISAGCALRRKRLCQAT